jgi:hypothetical protein
VPSRVNRRSLLASVLGAGTYLTFAEAAYALRQCGFAGPGLQLCQVGIASPLIGLVAQSQYATEWCWAASISMVFAYYGHPVSQARIVDETWGGIVNLAGQPSQILSDLNRSWVDDSGNAFIVQGDVFSVNIGTAAQDLDSDHPLLIGTLGHCMVLTALAFLFNAYGQFQIQGATVRDLGRTPLENAYSPPLNGQESNSRPEFACRMLSSKWTVATHSNPIQNVKGAR